MCGIAGVIDYSGMLDVSSVVSRMTAAIEHRGPNGHGKIIQQNVGLGHRRLSIIDLEGGRQPMSTPDGQVHLTYNGEVYNFRELRRELEGKGFRFRTSSDTEVVLYAYEAWGKRCVEHFEGMFAFAIADFRKQEVFLARDHFGIKPLLYRNTSESFAFASEFSALKQLPDWSGEIDLFAIDLYLRYQYIPAPHTAFRKVFKLPAGHRMTVRMGEPHQKIERYWAPDFSRKRRFSEANLIEELDQALRDSVERHLVADVPFGAFLSGGVDSSLVVGYMAELLGRPVKTFSIGFDDDSVNELDYARKVAKQYGTEHHEEIVRFDAIESLPELVKHFGEPFGDQSGIPTWAVARLARQHVPMVISGDGGDELFAGYSTYRHWKTIVDQRRISPPVRFWKRHLRTMAQRWAPARYNKLENPEDSPELWISCTGRFTRVQREALWRPEYRFLSDLPDAAIEAALTSGNVANGVNRVQQCDLDTWLPENILCKVDVASMRFGLEVRPPLLDRSVFELAASIPTSLLTMSAGRISSGKVPLKNLLAKKMGEEFAFREKRGFSLPLESWLRTEQANHNRIKDNLLGGTSCIGNWFTRAAIDTTIDSGTPENIWLLMVLEEWLRQNSLPARSQEVHGDLSYPNP